MSVFHLSIFLALTSAAFMSKNPSKDYSTGKITVTGSHVRKQLGTRDNCLTQVADMYVCN